MVAVKQKLEQTYTVTGAPRTEQLDVLKIIQKDTVEVFPAQ